MTECHDSRISSGIQLKNLAENLSLCECICSHHGTKGLLVFQNKMPPIKNAYPKDTNAPRKPPSSYFLFQDEIRRNNSQMTNSQINKMVATSWKNIDGDEKGKYEQKAKELKERYKLDVAEYKKTENYAAYLQRVQQWKQEKKDRNAAWKRDNREQWEQHQKKKKHKRNVTKKRRMLRMTKTSLQKLSIRDNKSVAAMVSHMAL